MDGRTPPLPSFLPFYWALCMRFPASARYRTDARQVGKRMITRQKALGIQRRFKILLADPSVRPALMASPPLILLY